MKPTVSTRPTKLHLISRGPTACALFLAVGVLPVGVVLAQTPPTPTWSGGDLSAVRKQIILRTLERKAVPGITVYLMPAAPTLGGPDEGTQSKNAVTDAQGHATFTGLGHRVWMVSFNGTWEGKAIQPAQEQGRAPYGRTRAGGGFPVVVQRQEEDTAATPVLVQGTPQPEIQPSLFVLVPVEDEWVPSLDLALPGEHPQPITGAVAVQPTGTTTTPVQVQADTTTSAGQGDISNFVGWFYALPVAVALLILYKAWQARSMSGSERYSDTHRSGSMNSSEDR
jgi:hypothetical protein